MSKSSETDPKVAIAPADFAATGEALIANVFAAQRLARLALDSYIEAQSETVIVAPEGHLISVRALSNGAMTEVWNVSDPDLATYHLLKKGDIRYAPKLRFNQYGDEGELLLADTAKYDHLYFDLPSPCYINNRYVALGLISLREYRDRQVHGDLTLSHLTPTPSRTKLPRLRHF
jgi:hypothetical protein